MKKLMMLMAGLNILTVMTAKAASAEAAEVPPVEEYCTVFSQLAEYFTVRGSAVYKFFADKAIDLLMALVGIVLAYFAALLLRWIFTLIFIKLWKAQSDSSRRIIVAKALRSPLMWGFFLSGAWISVLTLSDDLPACAMQILNKCFASAVTLMAAWLVFRVISIICDLLVNKAQQSEAMNTLLVSLITKIIKAVVFILALLFIAQAIFKLNITALLAGAGVIGLAVALAAQDTLANFFGSLMILIDKPFSVNDRVKVGGVDGIVESVGFRSTKIRALDGNVFQMPNRQVADSVLENVSKRPNVKYVFDIGLVYQTTPEQMQQAMDIVKAIIAEHPGFDLQKYPALVNFSAMKDWSLNITVVVWFNTVDFAESEKWKNDLHMEILKRFNAAGLSFAYPTSTQFLTGDKAAPVIVEENK